MIYFDHASSTRPFNEVAKFLKSAYGEIFYNPIAAHGEGKKIKERIDSLKLFFVNNILKRNDGRLITTYSATIANNLVLLGLELSSTDEIIYFSGDHPSLVTPIERRNAKKFDVNYYEQDFELEKYLNEKTKLVVISAVNNQSGQVAPVEKIAETIKKFNSKIHLHVDASQSFGKVEIDYHGIDSITFSGHKMGGVKGSAGFFLKNNIVLQPIIFGGKQQEGINPGTEDVIALEALVLAAEISQKKQIELKENFFKMSSYVKNELQKIDKRIEFPFQNTSSYITTFIIPYFPSDVFLRLMEEKGMILSSTAACSSKIKGFNSTFKSLGIKNELHKHVVRLSFGYETTFSDVEKLLLATKEVHTENAFLI